ncbi:TetR/AcrR family transcriptional regulator [Actinomadura verrucosospora]|uniref:TetR family transcriptional regulator n=1 Tax=Actinomadura verrucosospora TaxID=46165 RepID=A0A7D3VXE1_ACTVE|nr:TetR/AcrR family transcriptional regulator [Actinomadura verrucosospora]QKG23254.1 TetR family transcriptional regulator [Actinomadura verrucosospora]
MPRIWSQTIEAHRDAVREATLDAAAALVAERGLTGVTMSQIAKDTGIGRATLYKYFPDVESILSAWHDRQIDHHLQELLQTRDRTTGAAERLEAVLTAYAGMLFHRRGHDGDLAGRLHSGRHVAAAHRRLRDFVDDLLGDAAAAGAVREDVPTGELTLYCLHALAAAGDLDDPEAVHRLVRTTLTALRPPDTGP